MPATILRLSAIVLLLLASKAQAQRFLSEYDSTLFLRDTMPGVVRRFENLHFSGYIQPQFQWAGREGSPSFEGGNFSEFSNNRFMLRRARVKLDYILPSKGNYPKALFSFQIDATERGVNVRDMFLKLYEPKKQNFSVTMGLFARPFGYEINLSSAYRETPERGRMSQILMPTERDLGAMISYEAAGKKKKGPSLKYDIGIFNGQGLTGTTDFDSYKDVISRLTLKEWQLGPLRLSGGLSALVGGWRQQSLYRYEMTEAGGRKFFQVDSSLNNVGSKAPRRYYGADAQLAWLHGWGKTEWRAEYWRGTQPGTANSTFNPGSLPTGPLYLRRFDGAFFYFLQNLVNEKWEFMAKYDWYDPNTGVSENEIGLPNTNLTAADIKFSTLSIGLSHYFTPGLKLLAYYDFVRNKATALPGYTADLDDDIFTLRFQFRF